MLIDHTLKKYNLSWSYSNKDLTSLKCLEEVDNWEDSKLLSNNFKQLKALEELEAIAYAGNNKLKQKAEKLQLNSEALANINKQSSAYYQNVKVDKLISSISKQKIKLLSGQEERIIYNQFHTLTRRLSDSGKGYNILTLSKNKRDIIPNNDFLLEIDYNAFEPRVALGLLGLEQPKGDFYSEVFKGSARDQAKKKMLVWLYGDVAEFESKNGLEKSKLINSFYDGQNVKTIFGRQIPCSNENAISYLIQSTASDLILEKAHDINEFLIQNKLRTRISYLIHDSIVFDISKNEKALINSLIKFFSETKLGTMKLNVSLGYDSNNFKRI